MHDDQFSSETKQHFWSKVCKQ